MTREKPQGMESLQNLLGLLFVAPSSSRVVGVGFAGISSDLFSFSADKAATVVEKDLPS